MEKSLATQINAALWCVMALFWAISFRKRKTAATAENWFSRLRHLLNLAMAFFLVFSNYFAFGPLAARLYPGSFFIQYLGVAITAGGIALGIWARQSLGANWSGRIQIHNSHEIVRKGPYGYLRHPIYVGVFLGFLGSALTVGEMRGVFALFLVFLAYARKIHSEEVALLEAFGEEYERYQREVKAVIPNFL